MLSIFPEEMHGLMAFNAGASACLTRQACYSEFTVAIKRVLEGDKYVSPSLAWTLQRLHKEVGTCTGSHNTQNKDDRSRYR